MDHGADAATEAELVESAVKARFPEDTVHAAPWGSAGEWSLLVVSPRFSGVPEESRSRLVWRIIQGSALPTELRNRVSHIKTYATDELR